MLIILLASCYRCLSRGGGGAGKESEAGRGLWTVTAGCGRQRHFQISLCHKNVEIMKNVKCVAKRATAALPNVLRKGRGKRGMGRGVCSAVNLNKMYEMHIKHAQTIFKTVAHRCCSASNR